MTVIKWSVLMFHHVRAPVKSVHFYSPFSFSEPVFKHNRPNWRVHLNMFSKPQLTHIQHRIQNRYQTWTNRLTHKHNLPKRICSVYSVDWSEWIYTTYVQYIWCAIYLNTYGRSIISSVYRRRTREEGSFLKHLPL